MKIWFYRPDRATSFHPNVNPDWVYDSRGVPYSVLNAYSEAYNNEMRTKYINNRLYKRIKPHQLEVRD